MGKFITFARRATKFLILRKGSQNLSCIPKNIFSVFFKDKRYYKNANKRGGMFPSALAS